MIPGFELIDFVKWGGVAAVTFVIFAESGLMIGFFLPGDSLLFTTGFLASSGVIGLNIHVIVPILFAAAALGDTVGYVFGHRVGGRVFNRPNSRIFRQENIQLAERFYQRHGGKTIILARFTPVVRTFAPIIAGVAKMPYRTFLAYNLAGAFLWAVCITYAGYYLGGWLRHLGFDVDHFLLPIVFVILILSMLPPVIHVLRDRKQREAMWRGTKRQLKVLFARK